VPSDCSTCRPPRAERSFTVKIASDPGRVTARLYGELDLATAPRLQAMLTRLLDTGHVDVVVDLSQLRFLGVAGLDVLVRAAREFEVVGGRLTLAEPTPMTRRMLSIVGLDGVLVVQEPPAVSPGASPSALTR
jgi:anti-anti-sigma factor